MSSSTGTTVCVLFIFIIEFNGIQTMPAPPISLEYKPIHPSYYGPAGGGYLGPLIPPGKPWPASADEYTSSSTTTTTIRTTSTTVDSSGFLDNRFKENKTETTTPSKVQSTTTTMVPEKVTKGSTSTTTIATPTSTSTSTSVTPTSTSTQPSKTPEFTKTSTSTSTVSSTTTTEVLPSSTTSKDVLYTSATEKNNSEQPPILVSNLLPVEAEEILTPTSEKPSDSKDEKKCECKNHKHEVFVTIRKVIVEPNFLFPEGFPFFNFGQPSKNQEVFYQHFFFK